MIFPMLHLSNNLKEKKRNINIDLAILPSHDNYTQENHHMNHGSYQKQQMMVILWDHSKSQWLSMLWEKKGYSVIFWKYDNYVIYFS